MGGSQRPPVRYASHEDGLLSRAQALEALRAGREVWVEGGGGCVEGQLAQISAAPPGLVVRWNRGRHGRRAFVREETNGGPPAEEQALAVAERVVTRRPGRQSHATG